MVKTAPNVVVVQHMRNMTVPVDIEEPDGRESVSMGCGRATCFASSTAPALPQTGS